MLMNDEDYLDWVIGDLPLDEAAKAIAAQAREALIALRQAREQLAIARTRFVSIGDVLRPNPKATAVLDEIGIIVETVSAAGTLLEKGLRR